MSWKLNAGAQVCVVSVCLQVPVLGLSPPCSVPGCRGPMDAEDLWMQGTDGCRGSMLLGLAGSGCAELWSGPGREEAQVFL